MDYKFRVEFLEEANGFLDGLEEKPRDKIFYNIWKARSTNDKELFKKLQDEIWEFRTLFGTRQAKQIQLLLQHTGLLRQPIKPRKAT